MFSRLKKIAIGDDISLYHGTNSDSFLGIIESGQIEMSGVMQSNSYSDGLSAKERYDVPNYNTNHKIKKVNLYKLYDIMQHPYDYDVVLTDSLETELSIQLDDIFNNLSNEYKDLNERRTL